jgi:hypothetical protein
MRIVALSVLFAIACPAARSDGVVTLAVHDGRVDLGASPVTLTLLLDRSRLHETAGDLALRFEGISISHRPDTVFEIHLATREGEPVGVLSLYGVEGENGNAVRDVPLRAAVIEAALGRGSALRVIIVPVAGGQPGHASFTRLSLIRQ